jgi:hypothetical protein
MTHLTVFIYRLNVNGSYMHYKKHYFSPLAVRRVYSHCTRGELLVAKSSVFCSATVSDCTRGELLVTVHAANC